MKETQLLKFIFAGMLLVHLSCKCGGRVDCIDNGDYFGIRLVRDGKNAVFGPDAFIDPEGIRLFTPFPGYPDFDYPILLIDSTQSISMYLTPGNFQILSFPGSSDTLTSTTIVTHMSECCATYKVATVQWNGQEICTNDCGEVFEIEI